MKKRIGKWMKTISLLAAVLLSAGSILREASAASFPDVPDNAWYAGAVEWAVGEGVTSGRGGYFKPNDVCTRSEAVTFLYKLAGRPEVTGTAPFPDVTEKDWFNDAVIWAVKNHITTGHGEVNGVPVFKPYETCNRAMIVTFISSFAKYEKTFREPTSGGRLFPDVPENVWYTETVRWAVEYEVTHGRGGLFYPQKGCTRAEIVQFIMNYCNMDVRDEDEGDPTDPAVQDKDKGDVELPEIPLEDIKK